jgi:hypothetical protein
MKHSIFEEAPGIPGYCPTKGFTTAPSRRPTPEPPGTSSSSTRNPPEQNPSLTTAKTKLKTLTVDTPEEAQALLEAKGLDELERARFEFTYWSSKLDSFNAALSEIEGWLGKDIRNKVEYESEVER